MAMQWQSAYDLTIVLDNGVQIGLMVVPDQTGRKAFPGVLTPADVTEQFVAQDVPRIYNNTDAGAGYSIYDPRVPNSYSYGLSVETRYGCVLPGGARTSVAIPTGGGNPIGPIRAAFRNPANNTDLYFLAGKSVIMIPAGFHDPVYMTNLSSPISDGGMGVPDWTGQSATEHLGAVYIGGYRTVDAARPIVKFDGSAFTFANVAHPGSRADGWMLQGNIFQSDAGATGEYRMFASTGGGTSYKYLTGVADPLDANNWTPATGSAGAFGIRLGSTSFPLRSWAHSNQRIWGVKADGIFESTRAGTYTTNIAPYELSMPSADTADDHLASGSHVMGGGLFVADGVRGIDWLPGLDGRRNDSSVKIGYGWGLPYDGPVAGRDEVLFDVGDGWLGSIKYNASNRTSYICWGRPDGQGGFVWHGSWAELPVDRKATCAIGDAPFGIPRLWVASTGTGESNAGVTYLDYFSLPRDGNPLNDLLYGGPHTFATQAQIVYPNDPWGDPSALKTSRRISLVGRGLTQQSYLQAGLSADEGVFEDILAVATVPPYMTASIATPTTSRYLQTRVKLFGTPTAPPRLYGTKVRAGVHVEPYQRRAPVTIRFGEGILLNDGITYSEDDPTTVWNMLLQQAQSGPCTVYDWTGEQHTVQIEQQLSWILQKEKSPRLSTRTAQLMLTTIRQQHVWGDGTLWGAGSEWGA